tara:strand:+ start:362 stop:745 length:384 start_codon:yes stop_codon:yes gene_type:complete
MKQLFFGVLPFFACIAATAILLFLAFDAVLQGEYSEVVRRIQGLTTTLEYLESEGQITIHVNDWSAGETDRYESPAQALAWGSHHKLNDSIAEQQLPTIYLIATGLSSLAAIYIFAFGPRTPKAPPE